MCISSTNTPCHWERQAQWPKVSHRGAGCPRYSDRAARVTTKPQREPTPDVSVSESDYSSDDTVEDEDGDELTPAMDAAILRTLSKIRRKDEGVYGTENILQTELAATQAQATKRGLPEDGAAQGRARWVEAASRANFPAVPAQGLPP
jgi:hypothetical protein